MSEALARQHRQALVRIGELTERNLQAIWRRISGPDAATIREALMETVPAIAQTYGDMAGAVAADYYEEVREAAEVAGTYRAQPAAMPGTARYEALVRWGVDPLFAPSPDQALALSRIAGGLQRTVLDAARETIVQSSLRDPQANGWKRVVRSDGCSFCRMLADRGAVYSDDTVRFKSHDNCNCSAAPAFDSSRDVDTVPYRASKRNVTEADRARVREYLRNNY